MCSHCLYIKFIPQENIVITINEKGVAKQGNCTGLQWLPVRHFEEYNLKSVYQKM